MGLLALTPSAGLNFLRWYEDADAVVRVEHVPEAVVQPVDDATEHLVDKIHHDRISRLEEAILRIPEQVSEQVTSALAAVAGTTPEHDHSDYENRLTALETADASDVPEDIVEIAPPEHEEPSEQEAEAAEEAKEERDNKVHISWL